MTPWFTGRVYVFNVWPKTTLLFPVWPRDAKKLDTPGTIPHPILLSGIIPDPLEAYSKQLESRYKISFATMTGLGYSNPIQGSLHS